MNVFLEMSTYRIKIIQIIIAKYENYNFICLIKA